MGVGYFECKHFGRITSIGETWEDVRGGLNVSVDDKKRMFIGREYTGFVQQYGITRTFLSFDTSKLSGWNPDRASLLWHGDASTGNPGVIKKIHLVRGMQQVQLTIADWNSLEFVSAGDFPLSIAEQAFGGGLNSVFEIPLDGKLIDSWINTAGGLTKLVLMWENDLLNVPFENVTVDIFDWINLGGNPPESTTDQAYAWDTQARLVGTFRGLNGPMLEVDFSSGWVNSPKCYFEYWKDDGVSPVLQSFCPTQYGDIWINESIIVLVKDLEPQTKYGYRFVYETAEAKYTCATKYFTTLAPGQCPECPEYRFPWWWIVLAGIGGFVIAKSEKRGRLK